MERVHLLFEQSGTFKEEFRKLGYDAIDYDICDDFGMTDVKCDLFKEIWKAERFDMSVFDGMLDNELVVAFFPCVRFEAHSFMYVRGDCNNDAMDKSNVVDAIDENNRRFAEVVGYYKNLCELIKVCQFRNLRLVIENPYPNGGSFLRLYFPFKPTIIDNDRRAHGDYFNKPTAYWFFGFEPYCNVLFDEPIAYHRVRKVVLCHGIERSLISKDYARYFIRHYLIPAPAADM